MATIWINGTLRDDAGPAVHARDAGLLHGVGAFTTMAARGRRAFRAGHHLARLRASCAALDLPLPYDDAELLAAIGAVLDAGGHPESRLRLTVTGGVPAEGGQVPTVLLGGQAVGDEAGALRGTGMAALLLSDWKLNPYDPAAGHKTLDYAARFAALRRAARRECGEALWFNVHNLLQCGSVSNVFVAKAGRLVTPPDPGRDRRRGRLPLPAEQRPCRASPARPSSRRPASSASRSPPAAIDIDALLDADEVFVCNSLMRVIPVTRLEQKPVGDGTPGGLTQRLAAAVESMYDAELAGEP